VILARRPAKAAQRVRLGVGLLAGLAVLLMGAWAVLFSRLLDADRAMAARVREDAIWAVFQADRHAAALLHAVRETLIRGDSTGHDALMTAYDVLYSRAMLLERGAFVIDLSSESGVGRQSAERTGEVRDLAGEFDTLDPASDGYQAALARLEPRIAALRAGMAQLLLDSNQAVSQSRVDERTLRQSIHDRLGWSAGLLVMAFAGIGLLLAVQLQQLRRAHARMALLQRRSRQQAMRAKAASAAKTTFLATMSHEIRTPLNAIIGSAELLGTAGLDATQGQRVRTIHNSGQLLLDVINDILDYSKLDSRGPEVVPEPVDLPQIARIIESTFADRAAGANLQLALAFEPLRVRTDPGRLRQVIVNLVGNALKFTHTGGVQVTAAMTGPTRLRVEVHDTGIGIRPVDQARLFRDFEQIDGSYARAHGGTGLGLAICRRIVEGMGGRIGVSSAPGVGSTFWFEIPVERLGPAIVPESAPATVAAQGAPKRLTVLIVEDNPVNRTVMTEQLQQLGHHPVAVDNGFAALDRLASEAFDLILMDMQMPGISGPDTTRRLRAAGCDLPVIGVTANVSTEDRRLCKAAGMNGFLPKPVTLARLAAALADVVPPDDRAAGPADPAGQPGPAAATPGTPNAQLEDLVTSFGPARVIGLLDQFELSLPETEAALRRAVDPADPAAADTALHTFKGAALTLGLTVAGARAQALRPPMPLSYPDIAELLALAHQDLAAARADLCARKAPAA
jgi:two-component system, sensor histidine kinase